jgi:hypothetical protein
LNVEMKLYETPMSAAETAVPTDASPARRK